MRVCMCCYFEQYEKSQKKKTGVIVVLVTSKNLVGKNKKMFCCIWKNQSVKIAKKFRERFKKITPYF